VSTPVYLIAITLLLLTSLLVSCWLLFAGGLETLGALLLGSQAIIDQHYVMLLSGFFLLSLLSQLIIVPSGSLMLIIAGFTFGALPAAACYWIAQLLSAWPVFSLAGRAIADDDRKPAAAAHAATRTAEGSAQVPASKMADIPVALTEHLRHIRGNGLLASCVLRLTPVIPSAAACVLAALFGIRLSVFVIGTLLSGWIRPLFFASGGASLSAAAMQLSSPELIGLLDLRPLFILFLTALLLLLVRYWLTRTKASSRSHRH